MVTLSSPMCNEQLIHGIISLCLDDVSRCWSACCDSPCRHSWSSLAWRIGQHCTLHRNQRSKLMPLAQPRTASPRSHTTAIPPSVRGPWYSLRTDAVLALKSEAAPLSRQATFAAHATSRKCSHHHVPQGARAQRFCTTSASSRRGPLDETALPNFFFTGLNQSLLCHCSLPSFAHRRCETLLRGRHHAK